MNTNVKKIECKFTLGDKAIMFSDAHTIESVLIVGIHITEDYTEYEIEYANNAHRNPALTVVQSYLFSDIEELKNRLDKIANSGELIRKHKAIVFSE